MVHKFSKNHSSASEDVSILVLSDAVVIKKGHSATSPGTTLVNCPIGNVAYCGRGSQEPECFTFVRREKVRLICSVFKCNNAEQVSWIHRMHVQGVHELYRSASCRTYHELAFVHDTGHRESADFSCSLWLDIEYTETKCTYSAILSWDKDAYPKVKSHCSRTQISNFPCLCVRVQFIFCSSLVALHYFDIFVFGKFIRKDCSSWLLVWGSLAKVYIAHWETANQSLPKPTSGMYFFMSLCAMLLSDTQEQTEDASLVQCVEQVMS